MKGLGLKTLLSSVLEPSELRLLANGYDVVGDIAVLRIPETLEYKSSLVAEAIMQTNKHVKTVLCQVSPIAGTMRLRTLKWIRGEKKTETLHKEAGCIFKVDLTRSYFSPRLSYERMRIARQVKPHEVIVNMFAGVGCFSIIIAKYAEARSVYSVDINPAAIRYAEENARLNRVDGIVEPISGDAKEIIGRRLRNVADRVLMPLPEEAYDYMDCAVSALKPEGGWVHYYDFVHAARDEEPVEKVRDKVSEKMRNLGLRFEVPTARIVRPVGPRWFQIVLDILVRDKS